MELHSGPVRIQSSPSLLNGAGAMKESSGPVRACGSDDVSESKFWWTDDSVKGLTCVPVFAGDEKMGSQFVCAMKEGAE